MSEERKTALPFIADLSLDHYKQFTQEELLEQGYSTEIVRTIKENLALKAEETNDASWCLKSSDEE